MSFDDGIAYERARFLECVVSEQAAALRHVFSAERQARKVPGIGKDDTGRPIERAAVLGAGTMGAGIAMCFADAGIPVTVIEREQDALDRGLARVADTYAGQAKKGRIDEAAAATRTALVAGALGLDAAAASDVVVEAVFEDMDMKKAVFSELSKIAKPDAVLATNTSYLDVNEIAAATNGRDANVLGLHFFSPANIMKLLEVVRGAKTAGDVVVTGLKLGRRLGKTAIVSGVGHGFIGNRMFAQYNREAEFMLQEGATVDQVDAALYEFGMALGSFSVRDLAGLDIGWAMRKSTAHLRKPEERYSTVCDEICERGWFGQKSGKGFYVYDGGSKTMNPEVQAIVDQTGKVAGIEPNRITDDQIIERCVYALVNEGAKILEDGIALRASDIDLVFINGYGFPRWRGGPMHYADTVGLEAILETVCTFNTSHDFWTPAPLMERLVKDGRTFADWDKESAHCPKKGSEPLNQV
ncbi:MAG: 3-hydroxyacyl-CoA dehydrogenase NAD-binding domain-containing protein [Candidatus Binatia bacterium]